MPELRLNLITREWVIVLTERARRPDEFRQRREKRALPGFLASCPFCPGNEHKTPGEIMRMPDDGSWLIRVIPNKFPALLPECEKKEPDGTLKRRVAGVGTHEIIIESPSHNTPTALLPAKDIANILRAYKRRFLEAYANPCVRHVIIFKNQGEGSGTSIIHPHSQLVGTPITPFQARDRVHEARRFFDATGECLMCATLRDELADGRRIIFATEHFVTFIPFAALSPFHTWIFPKRHSAVFSEITDEEIADLSLHLKTILCKLYCGLDNPDFNYVVRSENTEEAGSESFHWYLAIVPRLGQASGFELGSGMYTNLAIPEEVAGFLRSVATDQLCPEP